MSQADLIKWNERYRQGSYATRTHATALLAEFVDVFPRGRALDIACGTGRNALFLAARGFDVDAADISAVGLGRARASAGPSQGTVNWIESDLENGVPGGCGIRETYDLIVWVRYINRLLLPDLIDRLSDQGVILCEQHLSTRQDVIGPKSDAHRVQPNELLRSAENFRVHYYREGIVEDPDGRRAALAQLIAGRTTANELDYC